MIRLWIVNGVLDGFLEDESLFVFCQIEVDASRW